MTTTTKNIIYNNTHFTRFAIFFFDFTAIRMCRACNKPHTLCIYIFKKSHPHIRVCIYNTCEASRVEYIICANTIYIYFIWRSDVSSNWLNTRPYFPSKTLEYINTHTPGGAVTIYFRKSETSKWLRCTLLRSRAYSYILTIYHDLYYSRYIRTN